MTFLFEKLRRWAFWLSDQLKGGTVKAHYRDLEFILQNYSSPESVKRRDNHLSDLLTHAVNSTQFYGQHKGYHSINDFPVINKNLIRENFDDFISSIYPTKELHKVVTSGSTGTPFVLYHDKNKGLRNNADTIYFAHLAGFHLGDLLIYTKIWSNLNKKSAVKAWMQNIKALDVIKLTDDVIAEFIAYLEKENSNIGILGYPSAFESICDYLERNQSQLVNPNIRSIIGMSETFNPQTRNAMKKFFGATPVSRYSNIENGIIAQQCVEENNEFHINTASYFVEIFDLHKDIPAGDGELGRIIVTDLFNYGMPMIRYDTGDIGAMSLNAKCSFKTPVLTRLEGRKLDLIYDTSGQLVSSYIVYKNMWNYPEIKQYQFIQIDSNQYILKVNISGSFGRENELIHEFKTYLGADAQVNIELVNEIPLLDSGKRKKVVNLMKQGKN